MKWIDVIFYVKSSYIDDQMQNLNIKVYFIYSTSKISTINCWTDACNINASCFIALK